ncbi:hypothetical protein IV203_031388 [Nitzschia inconspicua]|uniref:Uncharacterized protein n=1 Tax=Nitzschia inconspicua TaxID=303405 RepID=A0A9K3LU50_9STRA|nr:hypothetical protein IV203_031388 [Nitzschia inconspicua]
MSSGEVGNTSGGGSVPLASSNNTMGPNSAVDFSQQQQQQKAPPGAAQYHNQTYNNNMGPTSTHPVPNSQYPSRNGSPIMRPPSSASTASASSYHTGTTAKAGQYPPHLQQIPNSMTRFHNSNTPPVGIPLHGHHHPAGPPPPPNGHYNHPQGHGGGGLIRPTGRYPMPPRSNRGAGSSGMHMVRSGRHISSNTYHPQYHGGGPPPPHHYPQQQPNYGPMAPHYEYHATNYPYPEQHQQHAPHHGNLPQQPTEPSPMQTDADNQSNRENQNMNPIAESQKDIQEEEQLTASGSDEVQPPDFEQRNPVGSDDQTVSSQRNEQDTGLRPEDAQQHQQHRHHQYNHQEHPGAPPYAAGGHSAPQQYPHHPGYHPRDQQHYHQSYPAHQPYYGNPQQHHVAMYGQHGTSYAKRCESYHQGVAAAQGNSPPPPQQPVMPYHPSEYHLGPPAAAGHHGQHYPMQPQEHYQGHHGYVPPPQGAFQLPNYTARPGSYNPSPETTSEAHAIRGSPSPPPHPPVPSPQKKPTILDKTGQPIPSSESSESNKTALGERAQNEASGVEPPVKTSGKKEDATADAASILLQLGAPVLKPGDAENENPQIRSDNEQSKQHSIPQSVQGSHSMDEASEMTHPDLTSEPSQDSLEQTMQNRVLDTEFPCPIPSKYPTRLCLPYDGAKLNSLHCYLRSDLLEIFVVQKSPHKSPTHSPHSSIGRVGLRCVHCAMNRRCRDDREEAPMAVFYPKSVAEIYRLVTSWQRCHLRKCRNLPPAVRGKWLELRESDKSRGKTHYWVTSAKEIGLRDCQGRAGGIRFAPDLDGDQLPPQTRPATYIPEPEDDTAPSKRPPRAPVQSLVPPEETRSHSPMHSNLSKKVNDNDDHPPSMGDRRTSRMKLPTQNLAVAPSSSFQESIVSHDQAITDPPGTKADCA